MKNYRNVGKTGILSCFAGDTEVLTNHGWKPIIRVTDNDQLWDGEAWVHHDGVMLNGFTYTMNIDGLRVTPNHRIFTGSEWFTAVDLLLNRTKMQEAIKFASDSLVEGVNALSIDDRYVDYDDIVLTLEHVYDVLNAGPNSRFMVRSKHHAFIVHNCGYGVGWKKFSDTLLRQGIKLSEDLDKHREMARHAHSVYRMMNANIVYFWDTCQRVIEALAMGVHGFFAGPNNNTLEYGLMEVPGCDHLVPSIRMPSGYIIRYPNLHAENVEGSRHPQYFYDRVKGKGTIKTKIYGGAATENCIAEGTLVYTDSGWKPIETISIYDKVYDGVGFVSHSGVISKGMQDCICVDGIWMTPDHRILTDEGWQHAKETDVRRLRRCPLRGNGRSAVNDSISYASWMATGDVGYTSKQRKYQIESIQGAEKIHQEVFDILDCGPRHRFVIAGKNGPIIAHNCCQSLAFQLLMWQACRMAERGIHLHGNIHDSFVAVVPEADAERTASIMTECMSDVPEWLPDFPVACEAEIGDNFMVV